MTARKSRTAAHREDNRKAQGIHYTPPELAAFLAQQGVAALGGPPRRALDPACGAGELLAAVADTVSAPARAELALVGLDTDPSAVGVARARCEELGVGHVRIESADFLRVAPLAAPEFSLFADEHPALVEPVDLAIANPPYVRTQTIGGERVAEIVRAFGISGRVDLYQAFAFAMTQQLRPGGVLALLCPNRFLLTRAGEALRQLLAERYQIELIVDLGDTRLFEAAVLPAVIIATKTSDQKKPARYISIYERRAACPGKPNRVVTSAIEAVRDAEPGTIGIRERTYVVRCGDVRTGSTHRDPWTLEDSQSKEFLDRVHDHTEVAFGDVAKIRVGIKTTADKVFIRRAADWATLAPERRPEDELLRPLISNDEAKRWHATSPDRHVLYPHVQLGNRCRPVDLAQFPRAAAYLDSHRAQLEAREYVRSAGREWFEVWVPQKPAEFSRPKIVFPDIAEDARFLLDESGAIVNGDCYWMAIDNQDLALLVMAVGNSQVAKAFYDAVCGNVLYAGRRRFMTQYVERFPLPRRSHVTEEIIARARKLYEASDVSEEDERELDLLVAESFGLEEVPG